MKPTQIAPIERLKRLERLFLLEFVEVLERLAGAEADGEEWVGGYADG